MKLKCEKHNRRVLSISNSPSLLHRTGDMSKCDSPTAVMVDNTSHITRTYRVMKHVSIPNLHALGPVGCNKESRPHTTRRKE